MAIRAIQTKNAPMPVAHFSQAIVSGDHIFLAGIAGRDPASGKFTGNTIEQQVEQTFLNVKAVVEAAGSSMDKIVRCVCYLQTRAHIPALNAAFARHFPSTPPSRAVLLVPEFGAEGMMFEVIATASV